MKPVGKQVSGPVRGFVTKPVGWDGQPWRMYPLAVNEGTPWPRGVTEAMCSRNVGTIALRSDSWEAQALLKAGAVVLNEGPMSDSTRIQRRNSGDSPTGLVFNHDKSSMLGCTCGLYAFDTEAELVEREWDKFLHFLVGAWGRVVKAEHGFRAERVLSVGIMWPRFQGDDYYTACAEPAEQAVFRDVNWRDAWPRGGTPAYYRHRESRPAWLHGGEQVFRCKKHAVRYERAPWDGYEPLKDRCRAQAKNRGHRKATLRAWGEDQRGEYGTKGGVRYHTNQRRDPVTGVMRQSATYGDECAPVLGSVEELVNGLAEWYEMDVLPYVGALDESEGG